PTLNSMSIEYSLILKYECVKKALKRILRLIVFDEYVKSLLLQHTRLHTQPNLIVIIISIANYHRPYR
ncbi:MAG: hypothetical protein ACK5RM_15215, partial [Pseudanabaena sp.]